MMASRRPKRSSSVDDGGFAPPLKRPRHANLPSPEPGNTSLKETMAIRPTSTEELMRGSLRRSIALTLDHVGFGSSSEPALERLTEMTEEYLRSLIEEVKLFALEARRTVPTPLDYDQSLKRFNLGPSLLRHHLKSPIPRPKLVPKHFVPTATVDAEAATRELPLLGEELSGRPEKEAKSYIPTSFPDFPSIHTYKATPQDLDEVTVHSTGLKFSDGKPVGDNSAVEAHWKAGPRGDPQKMREATSQESKQAEEALRRVVRASKINQLKEARLAAQRNDFSRRRYDLWDGLMRTMIEDSAWPSLGGAGKQVSMPIETADCNRAVEIADHSMIVNAQKTYHRQEVSRGGNRSAGAAVGELSATR